MALAAAELWNSPPQSLKGNRLTIDHFSALVLSVTLRPQDDAAVKSMARGRTPAAT